MKAISGTANLIERRPEDLDFCTGAIQRSRQPVSCCYHCQRCGGGCPVTEAAGTPPNRFLRLLQLGLVDEVLENPLLWLCVGCSACGVRCPNNISTNEVIDQVRALSMDCKRIGSTAKDQRLFHRLFVGQVRRFGRIHELSLVMELKLRTRKWFTDLLLGQRMFFKGKLPLLPHRVKDLRMIKGLSGKRSGRS